MRRLRTILGWVATVVLLGSVVALALAEDLLSRWLGETLRGPDWVWWALLAAFAVFFGVVLGPAFFGRRARTARREARRRAREQRRRLENFELD